MCAGGPSRGTLGAMSDVRSSLPLHPHSEVDAGAHRLRVAGLVREPLELSVEGLRALRQHELVDDFACIEGWAVPGLRWRGPRLVELLELAGADAAAEWVQASADDFSTPLRRAELADALLAIDLGGEPLPVEHGGPVRLVVPGGVCYTSLKWLDRLDVRAEPAADSARSIALRRIGRDPGAS